MRAGTDGAAGRPSPQDGSTTLRRLIFGMLVLIAGNVGAATDLVLHPDISYFDSEHLIVGGITATILIFLFVALEVFLVRSQQFGTTLHRREERYRSIVQMAMDGFWLLNPAGQLLEVNEAYCQMSGYGVPELLATRLADLEAADSPESLTAHLPKIAGGGSVRFESTLRHKDGSFFPVAMNAQYRSDEGGQVAVFIQDIGPRKQAEKVAQERESLLATTLSSTVDGILVVDNDGKTILTNQRFADLWEIPPDILATGSDQAMLEYVLNELIDPDAFLQKVQLLYASNDVDMDTLHFKNGRILERYSLPLLLGGSHAGRVWSFRDVTERTRAEIALVESKALLKAIVDGTTDAVYVKDLDGRYQLFNKAAARFTGRSEAEVLGKDDTALFAPDEVAAIRERERGAMQGAAPGSYEETVSLPGGPPMTFWTTVGPIVDPAGRTVALFGVSRDITARKAGEKRLQALLHEKEALLREVHHRVKNNLQVVTSMLRLESARSQHPDTRTVLGEMQGRVRSMALLHEAIHRSGTFAAVDLGSYLQRVATEAFRALACSPGTVRLRLELTPVPVVMDQAMPCGLLVNELLANALEHGFPDGQSGEVLIELQPAAEDGHWELRVSDTGVGLPANFDVRRSDSLGLQLVADLAKQLGGTLAIGPTPAAAFTVTFPVHHKHPLPLDAV